MSHDGEKVTLQGPGSRLTVLPLEVVVRHWGRPDPHFELDFDAASGDGPDSMPFSTDGLPPA